MSDAEFRRAPACGLKGMRQADKKEPPELAARSAKQGGVKVQKMVGHPH
jgi:hypothetical protein